MTPPSPANSPVRGRLSHRNVSRRLRAPSLSPSPPSCTPRMTPTERALPHLLITQPSTDTQAAEDPSGTPPEPRAHALTANVLPGDTLSADPVPDSATAAVPATASPTVPPPRSHAPTVRSVFHLYQQDFACSLCPPSSFTSWCALATHRRSRHRHTLFVDKFVAACACARVFDARLAAALHGRSCGPRRTPPPSRSPDTAIPRRRFSHFGGTTKPKVAPLTHVLPSPNAPDDGAVASVASSTDLNSTTLEVAPSLASRLAASRDGIPPPTCAIGLAPSLPPVALTDIAASLSCPAVQPSPTLAPPQPPVATTASPTVLPCPATQPSPTRPPLDAQPALEPSHHGGRSCPLSSASSKSRRLGTSGGPEHTAPPAPVVPPPALVAPEPDYVLRTDGGCRDNGNASAAASSGGAGSVLFGPGDVVLWSAQHWIPQDATNNVAEYQALLNGLHGVLHWRLPSLRVECDSQLILSQISGNARVSLPPLRKLRNKVLKALQHLRNQGT
ncbi:hypothetical protein AeMF1_014631, partial [Aphanomyces euteiches]